MRDDRYPRKGLGTHVRINQLSRPAPSLMEYNRLSTLQQRLDALENTYSNEHPYDEGILVPRIARVAPMLAEPRWRGPPVNFQRTHAQTLGVAESIQELSSSDHATDAAATTPASAAARHAAIECIRASLYAPKRNTSYSSLYSTTTTTDTPTYSTPVNIAFHLSATTMPPYYTVASTSSSIGSTITSPSATANGATTDHARHHNFQAFRSNKNNDEIKVKRMDEIKEKRMNESMGKRMDERMDEPVPRKMAKRSEQHMTIVSAEGRGSNGGCNGADNADDADDDMMDCSETE